MHHPTPFYPHPDEHGAAIEESCTDHLDAVPFPPPVEEVTERALLGLAGQAVASSRKPTDSRPVIAPDLFPQVGARLLHFEVIEEIGRGAFARVYLARQEAMANRLVVLKVTTVRTDEPQTLAKLRHTNIIPVYSVHQIGAFQVICMPYLGRKTLARVLAAIPEELPTGGAALLADAKLNNDHELQRLSYADGCLWVIGQLASGLECAHRAGTLHRDLKPGNVLLTDDGTPMILDFNVSSSADAPCETGSSVGGTFPYMAPEHLCAFAGEPATVDTRSDLFSLGVMCYQMLTLELPFPVLLLPDRLETVRRQIALRWAPVVSARERNPAVSHSVASIVAKLLAPDPSNRYQRAGELREDISRHLTHRPLRHAAEPSVRECAAKWRKRNPRLATALAVAIAAFVLLALPATVIAIRQSQLTSRARELQRIEAVVAADAALADLRTAAVELESRIDPSAREHGLYTARDIVSQYGVASDPQWETRPQFSLLDDAHRSALKSELAEVMVMMARAEAQAGHFSPDSIEAGLCWSEAARRLFPEGNYPAVLDRLRLELQARRDGRTVPPLVAVAPTSLRDINLHFDGLDLVAADRYSEALPLLVRFCDRHPDHFQAWFARGVCHDALGQDADAATAFSVCLAIIPDFPLAVANRGIARLKQKRFVEAEADFTLSLELKPDWTVALVNRGLARESQRRWNDADRDFTAALADPAVPTRVYFLRSHVRRMNNDAAGAATDFRQGLMREPRDPVSWVARGNQRMKQQPKEALADFEVALTLMPNMREALLDKAVVLADYLHREADAVLVLDRFLELYPNHVEARAGRAVYLARLGRGTEARHDVDKVLAAEPTPYRKYQMAGVYAQLARGNLRGPERAESLRLLALALRAGFNDMKLLAEDSDLTPIRSDPEFVRLLTLLKEFELTRR